MKSGIITLIEILSALIIGLGTGFILQRGRACTNSSFRNLLVIGNGELFSITLVALFVLIWGYQLLDLIPGYSFQSNPIAFSYLFVPLGALIFGFGSVFAGGCAGGVCYRVSEGNLKALLSLIGFIGGLTVLTIGPIADFYQEMFNSTNIYFDSSIPNLEFFAPRLVWTLILTAILLLLVYQFYFRNKEKKLTHLLPKWTPIISGSILGLMGVLAKFFSSLDPVYRNFGLSTVDGLGNIVLSIVQFQWFNWAGMFMIGLFIGAFISSFQLKEIKLDPTIFRQLTSYRYLGGGFLLGFGAMMAGGCNFGHIYGGIPELGISSFIAFPLMILGNWLGSYLLFIKFKSPLPSSTPSVKF